MIGKSHHSAVVLTAGILALHTDETVGGGTATAVDLKNLDYCVVVDRSGSMGKMSPLINGLTRYEHAKETTKGLVVEMCDIDKNGITCGTFGDTPSLNDNQSFEQFSAHFDANSPSGGTTLAPTLKAIFERARIAKADGKQFLAHIVWDGAPSDREAAAQAIADYTKEMQNDGEIAIQFLQVGEDPTVTDYTQKLDDQLQAKYGAKFDIVDCKPLSWVVGKTMQAIADEAFNG